MTRTSSGSLSLSIDESAEITIDQLAHEAGIPTSTVRLYQNRGLLPPPRREGRMGYYNTKHRDRLRLIAHLQERGFSLAAIKETLDHWTEGRSLAHLLGVSRIAPSLERKPVRLPPEEFVERFAGVDITQDDILRAAQIGLVNLDGTDLVVANEAFLDLGAAVAKLGIPVSEILDEHEALMNSVNGIAERFRQVFQRHFWEPFAENGMHAEEMPSLTMAVSQLTELATRVVTAELHERFAAFAEQYLARAADSVAKGTDS